MLVKFLFPPLLAASLAMASPVTAAQQGVIASQLDVSNRTAMVSHDECPVSPLDGSDSANPSFLYLESESCVDVPAGQKLWVQRAATCNEQGSEQEQEGEALTMVSRLARYNFPGCRGTPAYVDTESEGMFETCLDVSSPFDWSYAFLCADDVVFSTEALEPTQPGNAGSILSFLGVVFLILLVMGAITLIKFFSTVNRWLQIGDRLGMIFSHREGAISL
ncbi:hypothetical protein BX600DRAFT_442222 [Xylariales sp. PMI_506]|nr:hypothetical protein BX600DRAFT_442222 [Xylariales sp. PMI_506]